MEIISNHAPRTIWFFSDPHFDHESLVTGSLHHPEPARGQFKSAQEMNELIVANLHTVVRPSDHLYFLGDIAMSREGVEWLAKCPGHKRLILGNHDIYEAKHYLQFVNKVMAYREFDGMLFSHIPVAPWSMRWRANVHGHCHEAKPAFYDAVNVDAPEGFQQKLRYINISAEHTNYRPVSLEDISKWSRR